MDVSIPAKRGRGRPAKKGLSQVKKPVAAVASPKKINGNLKERKEKTSSESDSESGNSDHESDVPVPVKRGRGRSPKKGGTPVKTPVVAVTSPKKVNKDLKESNKKTLSESDSESMNSDHESDVPVPAKRGRGRPPKKGGTPATSPKKVTENLKKNNEKTSYERDLESGESDVKIPVKTPVAAVTSPKKVNKDLKESNEKTLSESDSESMDSDHKSEVPVPAKRGRGRPPKKGGTPATSPKKVTENLKKNNEKSSYVKDLESGDSDNESDVPVQAKRGRGRPPKTKNYVSQASVSLQAKRGRGRPPKNVKVISSEKVAENWRESREKTSSESESRSTSKSSDRESDIVSTSSGPDCDYEPSDEHERVTFSKQERSEVRKKLRTSYTKMDDVTLSESKSSDPRSLLPSASHQSNNRAEKSTNSSGPSTTKKGRGRPRKDVHSLATAHQSKKRPSTAKRGRGRPPKDISSSATLQQSKKHTDSAVLSSRKRGRPETHLEATNDDVDGRDDSSDDSAFCSLFSINSCKVMCKKVCFNSSRFSLHRKTLNIG